MRFSSSEALVLIGVGDASTAKIEAKIVKMTIAGRDIVKGGTMQGMMNWRKGNGSEEYEERDLLRGLSNEDFEKSKLSFILFLGVHY